MNTALMLCDPSWSTGNIVKCLQAALKHDWTFTLFDWSQPYGESSADGFDAVVTMSLTGPARNAALRQPGIAHACFGPGEMDLPEVRELRLPPGTVMGGGSTECVRMLNEAHPGVEAWPTPGFAHPRFLRRSRTGPYLRAGFVGFPEAQNIEVSGSVKRPEMFREICRKAYLTPVFSEKKYTFESMQEFYDSIDVLISTSSREGGPFGPFEAIACGVSMLSTDVGLVHDVGFPGRFDTVEDAVALCAGLPRWAHALMIAQYACAQGHTKNAIQQWHDFLLHAAESRRLCK